MIPALYELPAAPKRIVLHWTAGGNAASQHDRRHYHYLVQWDDTDHTAEVVEGVPVANNLRSLSGVPMYSPGQEDGYAAHVRRYNSYSVGVALCGMAGAEERPFFAGSHPIRPKQTERFVALLARMCRLWRLAPLESQVVTHEEVDRLLGVDQRGKWDIRWLPRPSGEVVLGDLVGPWIRGRIADELGALEVASHDDDPSQ